MPLRWITLVALLALTIARPLPGYTGIPTWILILCFMGYNLLANGLVLVWQRFSGWLSICDLSVVAVICTLSPAAPGPIFVLFLLVVTCAAVTLRLPFSILYTALAAALIGLLAPTLPYWSERPEEIRELGAQLIVLVIVGVATALLMQRLVLERAQAQAIRAEAARLAVLDRLRDAFLSSISHDLRTPLTAASAGLGMLETSLGDRLKPNERQLLGNIRRNVAHLRFLIDDLLTMNQLEAGALRLEPTPIDLRTVVDDAVAAVQLQIQAKGQTLEVNLPAPLRYVGDPRRLGQVMINLLCNAHQHTPSGTHIAVVASVSPGELRLSVEDDGPGLPKEAREAVFERFVRQSDAGGGSGLGLAIARSLVALHGGRLWVEDRPGSGCVFHLALPRTDIAEEP